MGAGETADIKLVRRPAKAAAPRAAFSLADGRTALRLAASLAVAWLLPQRWWPEIARASSGIAGALAGKSITKVAERIACAQGTNDAASSLRLAAELRGARYEVAFQCLRGYRPGGWKPKVTVKGREHLDRALQEGKGSVLWVAHFVFAPNVAKIGLHDLGYRVTHLSRPDHGFSSTRFGLRYLNPLRSAFEDRYLAGRIVFDRAHPAAALLRARKLVAQNGIVSFTAGAWEGASVVEADAFGARMTLAMGPVWLARAAGATLLPVFAFRTRAPQEFAIEIGAPIEVTKPPSEAEAFVEGARTYLARLQPFVTDYPGQWRGWSSLRDAE